MICYGELGRELIKGEATVTVRRPGLEGRLMSAKPLIADEIAAPRKSTFQCQILPISQRSLENRLVPPVWKGEIHRGPCGNDPSWIYCAMTLVIVPLDVLHIDRVGYTRHLVQIT